MSNTPMNYDKLSKSFNRWIALFLIVLILIVVISVWYIANLASNITKVAETVNASGKVEIAIKRNNLLSADYLAIVIPILVALAGSLLAFLGMNRLKMFDERIDRIRIDMLSEIDKRVNNEIAARQSSFSDELTEKMSEHRREIEATGHEIIETIQNVSDTSQKRFQKEISAFTERYEWLESIIAEDVGELSISSVADAHDMVRILLEKKPTDYLSMIMRIVDKVCSKEKLISGDDADYHNLSAVLAGGNLYFEAIRILEKGLSLFTDDTDLLSDMIEYATKNSQFDKAEQSVQVLYGINRWRWTWRCYEFVIDYYRAIGKIDLAHELCQEFLEVMPYEEHGYRSMAEITMIQKPGESGVSEAIHILQSALNRKINCAQCAQLLATLYMNKGQYQDAVDAASRAIMESAQDQPHIGIAHIFAIRGFAYDRLFMQNMISGESQVVMAQKAVDDYKMALELTAQNLGNLAAVVFRQVLCRLAILRPYIPEVKSE